MQLVPITTNVESSNHDHGEVYSKHHYVIKFVSDLRQVGGFLLVSSINKTGRHDIAEILLIVAQNTITPITSILIYNIALLLFLHVRQHHQNLTLKALCHFQPFYNI
jgi:hypothetical protein